MRGHRWLTAGFLATLILQIALAPPAYAQAAAPVVDGKDLLAAARQQIGVTLLYDPRYVRLPFPGGDLPMDRGVCTDVIVRALRRARGIDLQLEINRDLKSHWNAYPHRTRWRLTKPDPNIDHRRVPNLMIYFQRQGATLPLSRIPQDYRAGDVVAWDLGGGVLHIGIVSDRVSPGGVPLIVHNIGSGVREEDILFRYSVIGRYRLH